MSTGSSRSCVAASMSSNHVRPGIWGRASITSISSARRALVEKPYDLIIINAPLRDEFGTRFAIDVSAKSSAIVLLFVKNDRYPEVYGKVMEHGVLAVSKPTSTQMVAQSLRVMCTMRERLRMMEAKQATVEDKISEIRLFNRAKVIRNVNNGGVDLTFPQETGQLDAVF